LAGWLVGWKVGELGGWLVVWFVGMSVVEWVILFVTHQVLWRIFYFSSDSNKVTYYNDNDI
jgi:hypothetical protein